MYDSVASIIQINISSYKILSKTKNLMKDISYQLCITTNSCNSS